MRESEAPARTTIEAIWRIEAARLIGGLVRFVRDVDRAEDLAQEALLTALERWPAAGIPDNPGAWLMATAKHRAVDEGRRRAMMAMRLGRIVVGLVPDEAEVHGLLALMELQASRARARVGPRGAPVLLFEQDRARWDRLLITRGLAALERAEALKRPLGPYTIQAAIAGCHARAHTPEDTDWVRIVALYDALVELTGSPVVELNRAVAIAMAYGPAEGLSLVDELAEDPALRDYHLLPTVRGDLLLKLGRTAEAKAELEKAARMATNARERALLLARAASCVSPEPGPAS
jgi:predicted RNA polymerase sigma factor